VNRDAFQGLLFQIQLNFLAAHEYTHHIHRHVFVSSGGATDVLSEFANGEELGNSQSRAPELRLKNSMRMGCAEFLVLAHLLRGERRNTHSHSAVALNSRGRW
jgi:hypothetical protein